jgi:uncharacterized oxidoreductase
MDMSGNTMLITGGGSGIGRALAEAFHARGNQVIIAGRRQELLDEVVEANPGMRALALDISSASEVATFAAAVVAGHPSLNVVVHNAGIMRDEPVLAAAGSLDTAEATIATNLLGPIRLNSALLPHLVARPRAAVVTVSSGLAFVPRAGNPTYGATKAAIHSYTQSLRYQLQDTSVQVIELVPPFVQTELTGPAQATNPLAMPLQDYIDETIQILSASPDVTEVLVDRVKPQRQAEASGEYASFLKRYNDAASGRAAPVATPARPARR